MGAACMRKSNTCASPEACERSGIPARGDLLTRLPGSSPSGCSHAKAWAGVRSPHGCGAAGASHPSSALRSWFFMDRKPPRSGGPFFRTAKINTLFPSGESRNVPEWNLERVPEKARKTKREIVCDFLIK